MDPTKRTSSLSLDLDPRLEGDGDDNKPAGKQFLILLLGYIAFLLLGAGIFMILQFEINETAQIDDHPRWAAIKEHTSDAQLREQVAWLELFCPRVNVSIIDEVLQHRTAEKMSELEEECEELQEHKTVQQVSYEWSFIDALFFSMTVITTIGYGHISPSQPWGKVVCMLYAMVGVPLTGILLATTSEFFGEKTFSVYRSKLSGKKQRSQWFIVAATFLYIVLGFVVFIFLPAVVFRYVEEDWSYLDSVYFAFITLTTIGFGDYVTGRNMEDGVTVACYQIFVILWILTSLGYWVMVANFITRALRSKKLHATLVERAKLLRSMMVQQNDPVFIPQRSKNTLNFMMQLSSMLPVTVDSPADQLNKDAMDAAMGRRVSLSPNKLYDSNNSLTVTAPSPGIPGIASLFNLPHAMSATSLNRIIGESLVGRQQVNSSPDGRDRNPSTTSLYSMPPYTPSPTLTSHSVIVTSVDSSVTDVGASDEVSSNQDSKTGTNDRY